MRNIYTGKSRRFTLFQYFSAVFVLFLSVTAISYAASLLTLKTFTSGTAISSTDVNSNFTAINDTLATMSTSLNTLVSQVGGALTATTGTFSGNVTAPNLLGQGQTWQDFTGTRVSGTPYTNNTGRPIQVSIVLNATGSGQGSLSVGGVTLVSGMVGAVNATHQYTFIVPNSDIYLLNLTGGSVNKWIELR